MSGVVDGNGTGAAKVPSSLRGTVAAGGRWDLLRSLLIQVISLGVTAVLARVLAPEEFGFVAVATIVMGGVQLVSDFGVGSSIVLHDEEDPRRVSSVFWFSVALAVTLFISVAALSGPLAGLLGQPDASNLIVCGVGAVCLRVAASVPRALLRRRFSFASITIVTVLSFLVYGATAVVLAVVTAAGAWSILIGRLGQAAVLFVGMSVAAGWRPVLTFDAGAIREDLSFGIRRSSAHGAGYLRKNVDYWLVSRWFGSAALGSYYVAYVVPDLARQRLTLTVSAVLFPTIARFRGDHDRVARALMDSLRALAFAVLPLLALIAVLAEDVVAVLFGAGWTDAVIPLRWLSLAAAANALCNPPAVMLNASGRPGRNILPTLAALLAIVVGAWAVREPMGVEGVAVVVMLASWLQLVLQLATACRHLGVPLTRAFGALAPALLPLAAAVPAAMIARDLVVSWPAVVRGGVGGLAGAGAYGLAAWFVAREAVIDLVAFARQMLGGRPAGSQAAPNSER